MARRQARRVGRVARRGLSGARRLHLTERVDPAGVEETCAVFLDSGLHDGGNGVASICIDLKVDLSPAQARDVGARLLELADLLTPASPAAIEAIAVPLSVINEKRGTSHTPQSVAESLGIDPASMTKAHTDALTYSLLPTPVASPP